MAHVLMVDDEARIRDIVTQYLKFEGYTCDEAANGKQAVEMAEKTAYDLIIMDVMMPFMDGITALRVLRQSSAVPVILLTAKGEEYDKVFGFELGADDYVVKPFSPKELMARVKAILKRTQRSEENAAAQQAYTYKMLTVNPVSYEAYIDGRKLSLTPKEFELLLCFIKNKGAVLTREQLLNEVWGYDFYGESRTVDTHIKMLRNNLGEYRELIKTVWGVGYRYDEA